MLYIINLYTATKHNESKCNYFTLLPKTEVQFAYMGHTMLQRSQQPQACLLTSSASHQILPVKIKI